MSLRRLPAIQARQELHGLDSTILPSALERWNGALRPAAVGEDEIDIFESIGEDFWTGGGVTAKSVAADLRRIGARPVTVNINSPGGDLFEGIAIYNLLRDHPQRIEVKILGLAASAASIVAMAGDRIEIAKAAFIMIHNAWVMAIGDRHDMREIADMLEPFDASIAAVYADRTGLKPAELAAMMDNETWLGGEESVKRKFADGLLADQATREDEAAAALASPVMATRRIDLALARQGLPRAQRRDVMKQFKGGTPGAAAAATPGAGDFLLAAEMLRAIETLKS